jgi:hypothetical protein
LAFSACNKSKAADEATEAVESDKVEKFSLSSLVEAFLELVVEAIEALDRLALDDTEALEDTEGSLAIILFLVGSGGPVLGNSGGDSCWFNFDLEIERWGCGGS